MRLVKRLLIGTLSVALLLSLCAVPAMAAEVPGSSDNVIYFEDGSYITIELVVDNASLARATYSVSGHKTINCYNSSDEVMFTFTVYGSFTYNGTTATATSASYDYTIENSSWSFKSGSAYCSGNQAIADGSFKGGLILNRSVTATLTCSPDGTLS